MHVTIRTLTRTLLSCAALQLFAEPSLADSAHDEYVNTGYFGTVAIRGYDTVAYFTDGQPVAGNPAIAYTWLGADWYFSSDEHRAKFIENPTAFAPQYGGLCADGVAYDTMTANIDPAAWRIIDGKLYLNYDKPSAAEFQETAGFLDKAEENWPTLQVGMQ
jgi:YHS domain-containing protein